MQYKTIALELIQEQPELYEQLRSSKRLLPAMDAYAIELKASHEAWKDRLSQARPGSDPSQIAAKRWSWRSRTCGTVCPPHRRGTKRSLCRSTRR